MRYRFYLLLTVIAFVLCDGGLRIKLAFAHEHEEREEDRARGALERGEILPLDQIIGRLREANSGEIAGVELEKEGGIWIYEFKIISPAGRMVKVRMDAKTGKQIEKKAE